jgi:ribosomal protein S18 acetylase RimI-like enzyme
MSPTDFRQALEQVYLANPCQTLPNPLWKTLDKLNEFETSFTTDSTGINRLEAWTNDQLYIYWRRSGRQPSLLINRRLNYQRQALIHQDFLDSPTVAGFKQWTSHYRLLFRDQPSPEPILPAGYRFASVVSSPAEVQAISDHVAQSDSNSLRLVQDWLNSPKFTADLWVWAIDEAAQQPVGLGLAELDTHFQEASIEWVQVLPAHQRHGLGRALVHEVLRRISERAQFTTVTGPVEDRDNPGAFFRRCGFTGDDVWWLLNR